MIVGFKWNPKLSCMYINREDCLCICSTKTIFNVNMNWIYQKHGHVNMSKDMVPT